MSRQQYSGSKKFQIALEAIKGKETIAAYSKATTGQVNLFFDTHATQKTEKLAEKLILTSK
ncbi:hypothetical protein PsalN5692_00979 [Piscirickettsia salmonis]|uniref:hypothetical protein n=1 Tax=Piscirickettsia salmonis TaxID=1238 RepID=UPI0012B71297|nr:hypothetical protein [Piscirickettsia salmonis]QGP49534.1 hypothetical protein PsalN5692_00979 [Piscirickettsia salmonis]QGP55464.1 hypothetical protein PsalSR1_02910 [Piscirickettsia salmonis]QGP58692.1 hypothetical protein PsalBI1_01272 [Piscirickettsia salmonis]QGP65037.1 hypothetical protein PsalMR5_02918 [Piscirickettsia salmonis]